jgi:hypothetical protein
MVGMGFVHSDDVGGTYQIEVSGTTIAAKASLKAPWPV